MQEVIRFINDHATLSISAIVVLFLVLLVEAMRAKGNKFDLRPSEAIQMINHKDAVVLDTRSPQAFKQGHIIDAQSMSFKDMQDNPKKLEKFKNRPIIIVCNAGGESQKTAAFLLKQGYNAFSITDGIRGWTEAQMPLVKD